MTSFTRSIVLLAIVFYPYPRGNLALPAKSSTSDIISWIKEDKSHPKTACSRASGDENEKNVFQDELVSCLRQKSSRDSFNCCWNAILSPPNATEISKSRDEDAVKDVENFNCTYWSEIKVLLANCLLHDHHGQNVNLPAVANSPSVESKERKKQIEMCLPSFVVSFIKLNSSSTSKSHVETLSHLTSVISIESDPKYTNYDLYCPKDAKSSKMCQEEKLYQEKMNQICSKHQMPHPHPHQQQEHLDAGLMEMIERKKCLQNKLNDSQFEQLNICWHLVTGDFYPENATHWATFLCHRSHGKPEQLLRIIDECFTEYQMGTFALDTGHNNSAFSQVKHSNETINCTLAEYIFDSDNGPLDVHRKAYALVKRVYLAEKNLQVYCHSNDTQVANTLTSSVNCNNNNWSTDESLFVNSIMRFCWKYTVDTQMPWSGQEWKNFYCCQSTDSRTKMAALLDHCFTEVAVNLLEKPDDLLHQLSKCSVSLVDPFGQMSLVSK